MTFLRAMAPHLRYIAVILTAIGFGVLLDVTNTSQFNSDQRLALIETNNSIQSNIEREINEKILVTEGLAAAFAARPDMTQADYERIVSQLIRNTPEVVNVAAAPGFVIEFVYPFEPNRAALGIDLRARPDLMSAVNRSIQTGQTVIDGPIDLVQGGRAFITRAAVFEYYSNLFRNHFWGIVSLVVDSDGLFAAAGLEAPELGIQALVMDERGRVLFGTADVLDMNPVTSSVEAPGVNWTLAMAPAQGWQTTPPNRGLLWMLVFSCALGVVVLMKMFQWASDRTVAAETQLSEAIGALDDAFALYDSSARLIMCNDRYKELFPNARDLIVPGARLEDVLRRGIEAGDHPEAEGREEEWIQERVEAQKNPIGSMETQLNDGRWLRLIERITPSGNVAGLRVDITELKRALERSEAASAAKSDFLNTVSHELRTPLTVVLGYNAFLKKPEALPNFKSVKNKLGDGDAEAALASLEKFQGDLEKFSSQIEVSGQQLMGLISSILDLAAIEEGTLQINTETLELDPIINEVVEQFKPAAGRKGVEIEVDGQADPVFADPLRLRQILLNLVGNAVKFTEEGKISIRSRSGGTGTWVEIEDTGCGIAADDMDVIFDRFWQADASNSRQHGGVGLGLPIAKELAELQGGQISVTSVEGKGSVFRLELRSSERRRGAAAH